MRRTWVTAVGALALGLFGSIAQAADHVDGPAASADPAADVTDVYAWMSADATKAYLVMNVTKAATAQSKFSDKVKYVINLNSRPGFGMAPAKKNKIICTFDSAQKGSCWLTDDAGATVDFAAGDLTPVAGTMGVNGKMKVFAGLRNDAFFFNLDGFKALASTVGQVAGGLMFDTAGCPTIDAMTSGQLVGVLKSDGKGGAGVDNFGKLNVLSIVVAVDKTVINGGGKILGVWGSTNQ